MSIYIKTKRKYFLNLQKKEKLKKYKNVNGQASLEFILVLPVLIMAVLIISQLGYMVYIQNVLEHAAEQGARVLATTNSNKDALDLIYKNCSFMKQEKLEVNICPADSCKRKVGSYANVSVLYDFGKILDFYSLFSGEQSMLKGSCIIRMENQDV